ncbi:basic leucine zipper transcriptional factor ATF-like 3 isoform X1 [Sapajus apella]|uniref:Basic leucine zipper transcriptional factor ATF-like 3 isoform X1 n=1 Tax=Sapajus apella TaxID=9515 RepID=A0A6J3ISJ1_SAPAP|nr:basic leucine zipper transcriptional factor ATF-like 3 isoform X1 [Sapajus apella]
MFPCNVLSFVYPDFFEDCIFIPCLCSLKLLFAMYIIYSSLFYTLMFLHMLKILTCSNLGRCVSYLEYKSPEDDDRKVRRREKNRVAAQRSRKKQTQKADKLHEEYECLEQENTMLRREIGKLTEELKHLTEALKEHEKMCPLLLCPMNFVPVPPRPDPVAGCLPR